MNVLHVTRAHHINIRVWYGWLAIKCYKDSYTNPQAYKTERKGTHIA